MVITRRPSTKADLDRCVEMYHSRSRDTFLPVSCPDAFKYLLNVNRQRNAMFHLAEENDVILGFIIGQRVRLSHMGEDVVQQLYFCSETSKLMTVRVIQKLHNDLINFSIKQGVRYVLSSGSPVDDDNVFVRVLEKSGWSRRNFMAYLDVTEYLIREGHKQTR